MLSIIIPVYNNLKYTLGVLDSIDRNLFQDHEIIIIDDSSTDETENTLKSMRNIRYYRNEKNFGVTYSWNKGISLSEGNYILVINNDILFEPDVDISLMKHLKDPDIYIVGPETTNGINIRKGEKFWREKNICGWCWMTTKDKRKEIGPIDERLKIIYNDDWIFNKVTKTLGKKVAVDHNSWIHHYESRTLKDHRMRRHIQPQKFEDVKTRKIIAGENNRI